MSKQQKPKQAHHDLQAELERFKDLAARAQADVQNMRARLEREGQEHRKHALQEALRHFLPVVDFFQRAQKALPDHLKDHEWVKGFSSAMLAQEQFLASWGVKRMDVCGKPLDPEKCEVLATGKGKNNIVLEVFEDGYMLHDRILRPAKVKVGQDEA